MVRSDPHGAPEFLATQNKRGKGFVQSFQFLLVLEVAVLADLEFFSVGIVARVDTDFLDVLGRFHGGFRKKVNVRNQGKIEARLAYFPRDWSQGFGSPDARRGYAYDLAPSFG